MASKITCFYAVGLITLLSRVILADDCSEGKYGRDCNLTCHCQEDSCDKHSGKCSTARECQNGLFGPTCQIENRAYQKSTQSSSHHTSYWGSPYSSDKAIDGSHKTSIDYCFHATDADATQWLQADLSQAMRIREVWLLNRRYNEERMRQVTARVGNQTLTPNNSDSQPLCYFHPEADTGRSEWLRDVCNEPIFGRYVSVSRPNFHIHAQLQEGYTDQGPFVVCELGVASDPTPKPRPGQVRNLEIPDTMVTKMTVQWTEPRYTNLVLQNYHIDIFSLGSQACNSTQRALVQTKIVSADITRLDVSDLEPFTNYQASVVAATLEIEGGGLGKATKITSTTGEGAVNSSIIAPSHLEIIDKNSSAVRIRWQAPPWQHWEAPFKLYGFTVYSNGSHIKQFNIRDREPMQTIVYGLEAYTDYKIWLHFETKQTASEAAWISVKTSSDKPSPPTELELGGTEPNTLVWSRPSLEQLKGEFRGFSVRYTLLSICGCDNTTRVEENADLNYTYDASRTVYKLNLTTFLPGSLYMFSVSSRNDWGQSDSANVTTWTQPHKPDPPTSIRGKLVNDTTASFVWEGPQCRNYRGINHQFSWKLEHIDNPELSLSDTTMLLNITVTGAVRGGNYSLTVQTSTNYGFSEPETVHIILSDEYPGSSSDQGDNGELDAVPIAIVVVIFVLLIIFIALFVILWKRGRLQKCFGKIGSRKQNIETKDAEYDDIEHVGVQPSAKAKRSKNKKKSPERIALDENPNAASVGYINVQTPTPSAPVYSEVIKKKSKNKKKESTRNSSPAVYSEVDKKSTKPPLASKPAKPAKPQLAQLSVVYSNTPAQEVEPECISAGLADVVGIPIYELAECIAKGKANKCVAFKKRI